ncbi:NACHT domain-containing protein [Streptomyces sp. ID05-26A]|nr:NACHT domain-containing protein [Streptomyces sp. ID05-26A]
MALRKWVITAGLAVTVVVVLVLSLSELQDSDAYGSIAAALVAIGTAFTGIVLYLSREQRPRPAGEEADALAVELLEQWEPEVRHRRERFGSPRLIPLTWTGTAIGRVRLRPHGRLDGNPDTASAELADAFDRLPCRRLVVIGEPGSGKTFLGVLLTVGLLRRRRSGAPVPVFMSLSSWDPVADGLDDWLVRTLAATHYNGREQVVRTLLAHRLLLPVLDGLDELPDHARRRAVNRLNHVLEGDRPIVLTCRVTEYEDLIAGGAPTLLRAPVVRISPVTAAHASAHLSTWPAIAEHVRDQPDGPVAAALSTPLMLSVFTAAYESRSPLELLDTTRFASRHAVEDHLVDLMVDTLYPDEKQLHWLSHLAGLLHRHGDRDFRWWQLAQRTLSPWIAPVLGLLAGAIASVVAALVLPAGSMIDAAPIAAVFGVVITTAWLAVGGRTPAAVDAVPGVRGFGRGALTGAALVLVPGLPMLLLSTPLTDTTQMAAHLGALLALSLITALGVGLHEVLAARTSRVTRTGPDELLRQDRRSAFSSAAVTGVLVGALTVVTCTFAAAVGGYLGERFQGSDFPVILHLDLPPWGTHVPWPVAEEHIPTMVICSVLILVLFAAAVLVTRAWTRFLVARTALAITGRLPWRLMRFLSEARERGLLRVAGNGYQFWHVRLQERLVMTTARTAPARRVPRGAVAAVVVVLLTAVTAVTWAAAPSGCPATGWPDVDERTVRSRGSGTDVCFTHVPPDRWHLLAGRPLLAQIALNQPKAVSPGTDRIVVFGDLNDVQDPQWDEVLRGLVAAQEIHGDPLVVDLVHTDSAYTSTTDHNDVVANYAARTADWHHHSSAIVLDGTKSTLDGMGRAVIGLQDAQLRLIPLMYLKQMFGSNDVKESVLSKEKVADGISAQECEFLRGQPGDVDLDLTGVPPSYGLFHFISSCARARVLISEEDVGALRQFSSRLLPISVYYLEHRSELAWHDCRERLHGMETAVKACAAALLAADEGRTRLLPATAGS